MKNSGSKITKTLTQLRNKNVGIDVGFNILSQ